MKKILFQRAALVVFALAASSCAYDPAYTSVGASYSSGGSPGSYGFGDGYGYGGSGFSTSYFVSTGNPRWGYDPYSHSYYDYTRRSYYDPYLYGYYPRGYRPPAVIGVPHPHSWRPGRSYCPPPQVVRSGMIPNYRNREVAYRGTNYGWARQVRQRPIDNHRVVDQRPARNTAYAGARPAPQQGSFFGRPSTGTRPGAVASPRQPAQGRNPSASRTGVRGNSRGSLPPSYNTPVVRQAPRQTVQRPQPRVAPPQQRAVPPQQRIAPPQQRAAQRPQQRVAPPQQRAAPPQQRMAPPQQRAAPPQQRAAPPQQRAAPPQQRAAQRPQPRREESRPARGGNQGLRSLGQG